MSASGGRLLWPELVIEKSSPGEGLSLKITKMKISSFLKINFSLVSKIQVKCCKVSEKDRSS